MMKPIHIDLDVPADRAWHLAAENFGNTGQWTSKLSHSRLEGQLDAGGRRVCMDGRKELIEQITHFDAKARILRYELVVGGPPIMKRAINEWTVSSLDGQRSRLTMSPDLQLKWWAKPLTPLMVLGLKPVLRQILEEFKHWAETGELHPRKQARNEKEQANSTPA